MTKTFTLYNREPKNYIPALTNSKGNEVACIDALKTHYPCVNEGKKFTLTISREEIPDCRKVWVEREDSDFGKTAHWSWDEEFNYYKAFFHPLHKEIIKFFPEPGVYPLYFHLKKLS